MTQKHTASEQLRDFVIDELIEENWYHLPERMTVEDAEYCLKYYKDDGLEVPPGTTAEAFAEEWDRQLGLLIARNN